MTNIEKIEARVDAVNRGNREANCWFSKLTDAFLPMVGKKVKLASGGLSKKAHDIIQKLDLPCIPQINIHVNPSDYTLSFAVKACESRNGRAYYHDVLIYVGELKDGVLVNLKDEAPNFKTDYKTEEVIAARKAYREAQEAERKARSALFPFGEYDN